MGDFLPNPQLFAHFHCPTSLRGIYSEIEAIKEGEMFVPVDGRRHSTLGSMLSGPVALASQPT